MCLQGLHMRFSQMSTKAHVGAFEIWRQDDFRVLRQISRMADAKEICPQNPCK